MLAIINIISKAHYDTHVRVTTMHPPILCGPAQPPFKCIFGYWCMGVANGARACTDPEFLSGPLWCPTIKGLS